MNKKTIFFLLLTAISSFILGFCFGATDYHESMKGVNWTNIVSSVVSVSGFSLAFLTYNQWLSNKRKDDSYLVAKDYLAALNNIRETLREITFQYSHLCPAPGVIVEPRETYSKRIEHINNLSYSLYLARVNLSQAKSELAFWKVKLSDIFNEKHNSFNQDLTNINTIITGLNSQLYQYYLQKRKNIGEVIRYKEMLDKYMVSVTAILDERVLLGFEKVFKFE